MDAEIFPEGGQNHQRPKSRPFFRRTAGANENFGVFSRCFRPILSAYIASAEGASEKFMHVCTDTAWPDFCLIVTLTMWF